MKKIYPLYLQFTTLASQLSPQELIGQRLSEQAEVTSIFLPRPRYLPWIHTVATLNPLTSSKIASK